MAERERRMTGYFAGGEEFSYPLVGDPEPPSGAKVLLLTVGGICTVGPWDGSERYTGWAPLPRRNKEKETRIENRT